LKVSCPKCGQPLEVQINPYKLYCTNPDCLDYTKINRETE